MSLPLLQRSYLSVARTLRQAGLRVSQFPLVVQEVKITVEQWVHKELENGNVQQVFQVLKGHVQEKGPQLLFAKLKDLLLMRLLLHLGIRGALATNIITLLLPFVLKRVYEMIKENPKVQSWWDEQEWKQKLPSTELVKDKLGEGRKNIIAPKIKPPGEEPLFL